ncbi:MAG: D-alanine--D-alanine ligase [Bacillota bacterium]|uniref:D-alanine--D-alanine ligase n=1 Tax=Thermanaerosceptrum fracticalcis TaxID=1712410 RepID=A0A7G6E0M4_THEFR|nr:D-alanine--D-alanine ligase [Thermanaerosceptrum fracticalcis]QNB45628.1 D-alanine--D-alanine ligase [Thermanaerosceptrum fracticalcis]
MKKVKVALLFGGRSGEHEVSRNSAYSVAKALSDKYDVFAIGISKEGEWYGPVPLEDIKQFVPEHYADKKITILPHPASGGTIYQLPGLKPVHQAEVFFPVLHGTFGEDGTIQGLLDLAQVPYVGAGVLSSSVGMDKIFMKKIFAEAGLPQVPYLYFLRTLIDNHIDKIITEIEEKLGYPCFVKPANLGSSVGISKAVNRGQLEEALKKAARYDRKVIVEKGLSVRELEVSVLGNDQPRASLPGEIVPCNEFYDYRAKYIDDRSALYIPASVPEEAVKRLQELAVAAFKALDCAGLSRVDFFLTKDTNEILINEINTMPGFTTISMYPKLWEYSGLPITELVDELVRLAVERFADKKRNITTYEE